MGAGSRGRRYVRFLGFAVLIVMALLALGFQPTRRLTGDEGLRAMLVACAISFSAALMAAWQLVATAPAAPDARMRMAFRAMIVRLAVVVALGSAAVLSGMFSRSPLLFWLATSYVVLLPLEVKLAITSE